MHLLRERNILTQVHCIPVHLQLYDRRKYEYAVGECPVAESYYTKCLSLPLFAGMTDEDVDRVVPSDPDGYLLSSLVPES